MHCGLLTTSTTTTTFVSRYMEGTKFISSCCKRTSKYENDICSRKYMYIVSLCGYETNVYVLPLHAPCSRNVLNITYMFQLQG